MFTQTLLEVEEEIDSSTQLKEVTLMVPSEIQFLHIIDNQLKEEFAEHIFNILSWLKVETKGWVTPIYLNQLYEINNLEVKELTTVIFYSNLSSNLAKVTPKISEILEKLNSFNAKNLQFLIVVNPYLSPNQFKEIFKHFDKVEIKLAKPLNFSLENAEDLKEFYLDFIIALSAVTIPVLICVDFADLLTFLSGSYLIKVLKVKGLINYKNIFNNLKNFQNTLKSCDKFFTTFFAPEEITLKELDEGMIAIEDVIPSDSLRIFSSVFLPKEFKKYFPKTVILLSKTNFSKKKENPLTEFLKKLRESK